MTFSEFNCLVFKKWNFIKAQIICVWFNNFELAEINFFNFRL